MKKIVKFLDFDIILNFKKNTKSLRLRIGKDAKISLSLPQYSTQKVAFEFLNTNKEWLITTHQKIKNELAKNDEFIFLGKIYKVKFNNSIDKIEINKSEIYAKDKEMLECFKKAKANKIFNEIINKFIPHINRCVNRLTIRKMDTRWGSCNSSKGYINLNLNLICKPLPLIEYVVLHELTHLLFPHHKKSFYDFIQNLMPDFRIREKELNKK